MKSLLLVLALSLALPTLAEAQARRAQVYRCGPDGRDLRDSPCPSSGGASQPGEADGQVSRDRQLAEVKQAAAQAQARYAREAEARRQRSQAYGLQDVAAPSAASAATGAKPRKAAASAAH